jgi:RNA polymerase sigma-70 factor (ECF subfamily)
MSSVEQIMPGEEPNRSRPSKTTSRDASALVRVLTQNERRVYAFILSLVPNWSDADEILQETNVRLWNEFERFQPGTDFGAWACAVAKFQVLTHRKRAAREKVKFTGEFIDVVAHAMAEADDSSAERHRALQACVEELNPTNREMLRAYYRHGAVGAQVAAAFGRSIDALYKSLSRIRRALLTCVEMKLKVQVEP